MASKYGLLLQLLVVFVIIAIKTSFFIHEILSHDYLFDEIYYVSSAKYFIYRLGLSHVFVPPISGNVTEVNKTIIYDVTMQESYSGVNLALVSYNWGNLEHPGVGKLLYGLMIMVLGSLPLVRLLLLVFSLTSIMFFSYVITRRYGLTGVISLIIFFILDGTFIHLMYAAVLDTLMLAFFILAMSFTLTKRYGVAFTFLCLSTSVKEVGLVLAVSWALFVARPNIKKFITYSTALVLTLVGSYSINLLVASPIEVFNAIFSMSYVKDPFACVNLCLLSLKEKWGIFTMYPLFIWVWFAGLLVNFLRKRVEDDVWLAPYLIAEVYVLFIVLLGSFRSIYVFYYAPVLVMSVIPISDCLRVTIPKVSLFRVGRRSEY